MHPGSVGRINEVTVRKGIEPPSGLKVEDPYPVTSLGVSSTNIS